MPDPANDDPREGEQKSPERLRQELDLILNAAGDGIYGIDCNGLGTFANRASEQILGWKAEQVIGHQVHALHHHSRADGGDYPVEECPVYAAFRDGKVHRVDDEVFWRVDGTCVPVEYTSTPIYEGGKLSGAVVVFKDVSERKRNEQALKDAYAEVARMKERLEAENTYLAEELGGVHNFAGIVGNSPAIQQVLNQVELVAPTYANVLITGESGTGKELVARAIHERSERQGRPLIRVNCAAIPRELFESEFFGHQKGAFTGAIKDRAGRFELADGGTIFLDEVGEIPLELQSKLLRVLQESTLERVGESRTRTVDVRVIAATNRDLPAEIEAGRFREDLYFRLNVFPIEAIALRKRREDIPALAQHFIKLVSAKLNRPQGKLSQANIKQLMAYNWPGNIRELQNIIERAVIISAGGKLHFELPGGAGAGSDPFPSPRLDGADASPVGGGQPYDENERLARDKRNIEAALHHCKGKVSGAGGAAELLGIKPTTLTSRMKALGVSVDKLL